MGQFEAQFSSLTQPPTCWLGSMVLVPSSWWTTAANTLAGEINSQQNAGTRAESWWQEFSNNQLSTSFLPKQTCQKQPGDFDMKDFTPQGDVNPAMGRSAWHVPWMTMETAGATLRRAGDVSHCRLPVSILFNLHFAWTLLNPIILVKHFFWNAALMIFDMLKSSVKASQFRWWTPKPQPGDGRRWTSHWLRRSLHLQLVNGRDWKICIPTWGNMGLKWGSYLGEWTSNEHRFASKILVLTRVHQGCGSYPFVFGCLWINPTLRKLFQGGVTHQNNFFKIISKTNEFIIYDL